MAQEDDHNKDCCQNGNSESSDTSDKIFEPPKNISENAFVKSIEEYQSKHKLSITKPEQFWGEIAEEFYFHEKNTSTFEYNFDVNKGPISISWLKGAKTNISYNVLDRCIDTLGLGKNVAYYWEGNDPEDHLEITYEELRREVCKFANALKSLGLKKGDRVAIYMPMVIELAVALLACARIGVIHSVVFGGYSAASLAERILDAKASVLVTADGAWRGDKIIHLKEISDEAMKLCEKDDHHVEHCIVVNHLSRLAQAKRDPNDSPRKRKHYDYKAPFESPRDKIYQDLIEKEPDSCTPEWLDSEEPLFILYTSGSTGKPKGVSREALANEIGHNVTANDIESFEGNRLGMKKRKVLYPLLTAWLQSTEGRQPGNLLLGGTKINTIRGQHHFCSHCTEFSDPNRKVVDRHIFEVHQIYPYVCQLCGKGVLHTVAGYMIYVATTFKYVFDYHPGDIYWCTADIGWITGHSYVVYGPLANGASSVMFEGTPFYPDNSRLWAVIEKYKVTQFYTAPTAIRSLMKFGDEPVQKYNLDSLKILGSVGEPINPEAWLWYHRVVGKSRCAIVDTFWQTETGGHVITPLPGATSAKPGSATFPFFGVVPELFSEEGQVIEGTGEGYLVFKQPWPGIMRTVYRDHERFETTYFKKFPGYYCTGDGAKRDEDGYLWITGRVDDMLNVSGHLLSTAQVESALIEHKSVSESAVVAVNHDVKGEALYCFVTLTDGSVFDKQLVAELKQKVREKIGAFATPEVIQNAPALPKTRSGKIMRRILRKIAAGESEFGDTSTLADIDVIKILLEHKP